MKKIKILMIVGRFFPEISGGNLQCKKLIDELREIFSFNILTYTKKKNHFLQDKKNKNIKRIIYSEDIFGTIKRTLKIINYFINNNKNFSIIHIYGISKVNILYILLSKIFFKKIIVKFSSYGEDDLETIRKKSIINFFLHKFFCDKFICNAPIFYRKCRDYNINKNRINLIPNFLLQKKKNTDQSFKIKLNKNLKNVLCIGHFSDEKRHFFSYKIWKKAYFDGYKSNLTFVGRSMGNFYEVDSNIKKKIINDAKKNKILKNIFFFEFTTSMNYIYQNSNIFLMPSIREGMPSALIESIYHGLDCLCLELPSLKNYLKYRNLSFVKINSNIQHWTKMLIVKLNSKKKKKMNTKIIEDFDNDLILKNYVKLYKDLNE